MKKTTKLMAMMLAVVMLCSVFATTAFASSTKFTDKRVYGGPSQTITTLTRQRSYNIEQKVTAIIWNGQSSWKVRGYSHTSGAACTDLSTITGVGSTLANFTTKPATVQIKNSIASTSSTAYLTFSGTVYV